MKIHKAYYYVLNTILFLTIIFGYYELVSIKTLVAVFIIPAFIMAVSLGKKVKNSTQEP